MEVFVARQPIFDRNEEVFGYELFYRSTEKINAFPDIDGDEATADVIINSFINIGIDRISNRKPCFINFTENLLIKGIPSYFNAQEIIVELQKPVKPSQELVNICKELRALGYRIALDDSAIYPKTSLLNDLLASVDIIKVDFHVTHKNIREEAEKIAKSFNVKLAAEKIETEAELTEAKRRGYDFFQGYYLSRPVILSTHDIPEHSSSYKEIIENLSMKEPCLDRITELIERDISLSYKLLKLINSASDRSQRKINSIRQAISTLGFAELKRWMNVLAIRESIKAAKTVPEEVIRLSLTRAKMCEKIEQARLNINSSSQLFMTGMLSMIDSLLSKSMEEILQDLPLDEAICEALTGNENSLKNTLDLAIAAEKAQWKVINEKCKDLKIDEKELFKVYAESLNWFNQLIPNEEIYFEKPAE